MDPVVLSVTQLCRAAVDPAWRAAWIRGEQPSVQVLPPPGTVAVYGTEFHAFANRLVRELLAKPTVAYNTDGLFQRMLAGGGEALLESLLTRGEVDSAALLTQALNHFAERVRGLWDRAKASSWHEVFVAPEYPVTDARFEIAGGIAFVSGALDCVRHVSGRSIEVVDYKLTRGVYLEKELVQVALYRQLLKKSNGTDASGALEYFLPELVTQDLTASDLDDAYNHWVVPALVEMIKARQGTKNADPKLDASAAASFVIPLPQPPSDAPLGTSPNYPTVSSSAGTAVQGSIALGTMRGVKAGPISIESEELKRHVAVLGGTGSGKTTLALSLLEQLLLKGIPVLLVDRKGDLCRYGDDRLHQDRKLDARLVNLFDKIDVAVFTPGEPRGRPLSITLLPAGLEQLPANDRVDACKNAAAALSAMLQLKSSTANQAKQAILLQALRLLAESQSSASISLEALIEFIGSEDPSLLESIGRLDPKQCGKLASELTTMSIMRGELLARHSDELTAELLFGFGPHRIPSKTRLSIISTKFFTDSAEALFWISQLLGELNRFASRSPSPTLQAAVMFDEADIYLPATAKPPTKVPLENLLKRARSAGISVLLATQSPGDLDYKCRENVRNWFVGLVKEPRAIGKLEPMLAEAKLDAGAVLPKQKVGQFFMISESQALPFAAERNLLPTEQLSEPEIASIARGTKKRQGNL